MDKEEKENIITFTKIGVIFAWVFFAMILQLRWFIVLPVTIIVVWFCYPESKYK